MPPPTPPAPSGGGSRPRRRGRRGAPPHRRTRREPYCPPYTGRMNDASSTDHPGSTGPGSPRLHILGEGTPC
ncbi:hypothetical protein [Ornithinimicrobium kibberense]|uniref:hypothetical protein n=1 Tax=Ornithinimicrobium kibberense TaxID=282060 RepID=UPI00361AAB1D